ncbi:hypothetical protein U9M48_031348 [Paspalum notatum var. saurae]|uniref:DUF4216 domain-containing protein n=1 Tax=Paspalum notatum var. saurae TaxID=547442 RepID=A0AAQ3U2M2_PASNO
MMMDMLNDLAMGFEFDPEEDHQPLPEVQEFYRLLEAGDEKLHDHTEKTVLDTVSRLMAIKLKHNISNSCFNDITEMVSEVIRSDHKLPKNLYFAKKMMAALRMKYEKIDVYPSNCMLFWREDDKLSTCRHCGKSRYIQMKNEVGDNVDTTVPAKQLRHGSQSEDVMVHPADGDAWKALDKFDHEFARDPRSVRLGLATDGITPFSTSASPYSCWPVFIMPYNVPPEMVLKDEFIFLALVIPGPEDPGKNLNVFLRPLIEELKQLWTGVKAYNSYAKKEFNLRATYLWSVHDLPAYGNFVGWSVKDRLQCPICMDDSDAYRLKHGGKYTFFDCTRRGLPPRHKLRQSTTAFRKSVKVRKLPSKRKTAKKIMAWHRCLKVDPSTKRFHGYGELHNWTHISLLWELPYSEALMLPHNIDLMHQERNVAESICLTDGTVHKDLAQLSHGLVRARTYSRYDVSGFRFRTAKLEKTRPFAATVNSGVMTTAYDANENVVHYYGALQNIVKYEFDGPKPLSLVFFECDWFHPHNGTRVDNFGMVKVKHGSKLEGQDNVVLAHQAQQVYYLPYPHPSLHAWWVAFKVNPQVLPSGDEGYNEDDDHDVFQEGTFEKERSDDDDDDNDGFQQDERVQAERFHVTDGDALELLHEEDRDLIEEPTRQRKRPITRKSKRIKEMARLKKQVMFRHKRSKAASKEVASSSNLFQGTSQSRERQQKFMGLMDEAAREQGLDADASRKDAGGGGETNVGVS